MKHPIFEKLRFWAIWTTLSDRARRDISIASILASRGPLHPIFEAFLYFDCFLVSGFTFLASYHITNHTWGFINTFVVKPKPPSVFRRNRSTVIWHCWKKDSAVGHLDISTSHCLCFLSSRELLEGDSTGETFSFLEQY